MLADVALPARFWPHAVQHAAHLYNLMAHSAFDYQFSPHAAFYGTPPRFHHLHPFGILMYYKILPVPSKVLPQQAQVGIFWALAVLRMLASSGTRRLIPSFAV
jgi:hypothetical protein